jgi:hypothetical protein
MYRRLASELTDPGTIGFAPSIAMNFGQEAVATPQSSIARSFKRELRKPLEELHHPLRPVRPLLYLGTFREWARGGKPEMYFLTRSLKNRQEHVAYSQAHEGDSDKDKAPKTWMDGVEFLLHPHGFKMTESADVFRERLWNLTDTLQDSLQESAKGGIYLLSQAYKNAPGILRDFFVQFDNQP